MKGDIELHEGMVEVSGKVTLDGREWAIPNGRASDVAVQIKAAMESGTVVSLELLDQSTTPVTVYFNGRTAVTAVVNLDTTAKPTEISD